MVCGNRIFKTDLASGLFALEALGDEADRIPAHVVQTLCHLPPEFVGGFVDTCDQLRDISKPALNKPIFDGLPDSPFESLQHLEHAIAASRAQIVDFYIFVQFGQLVQSHDVAVSWLVTDLPRSVMWM